MMAVYRIMSMAIIYYIERKAVEKCATVGEGNN